MMLVCSLAMAQTAKEVLDKTAQAISNKGGATAAFSITNPGLQTTSGTIDVKDKKFRTTMQAVTVWFDGKTQWTYMKQNAEVNINTPTEAELQTINPYNFIYMYRNGYKYMMKSEGGNYVVGLKASDNKHSIKEMEITVNKKTYIPSRIKMQQNKKWFTINITSFKKANLNDNIFRFNQKDYPNVEVIDLR